MALDYTFQQVKDFLKAEESEPQLIDAIDKLLGLTLICTPILFGPAALPLLGLLTVKNELTKLGTSLFQAVTKKGDKDFLVHQERLRAAYTLICYTSFFEAVDRAVPQAFRKQLSLTPGEKDRVIETSLDAEILPSVTSEATSAIPDNSPFAVSFPHPVQSLDSLKADLTPLYEHLAKGLLAFIRQLPAWDHLPLDEGTLERSATISKGKKRISPINKHTIEHVFTQIPSIALNCFESQYAELAMQFEDFAVWSNLHEHRSTRQVIAKLSLYVQERATLSANMASSIDAGFNRIHHAVTQIPRLFNTSRAEDIVAALARHYRARVDEPIIESKYDEEAATPHLAFPKIKDAFIPQAYRVIVYTAKTKRLENEETWQAVPARQDLGAFLLSYLTSPYSLDNPLIILGHPGSGKSLLTKILSANLLSNQFTPIRVALREVDSEASIPSQVEQYINSITRDRLDSWARFSSEFKNNPPVIILDGYDELLQASGKVFSGYLKDARNFQRGEAEQERPVRIIVTSRLTLIDKAAIPEGATIIRLLGFDKTQRDAWVSIWNNTNREYFASSTPRVAPFALPEEDDPKAKSLLGLAEQPLLLLMLALYDSEENRLKKGMGIDRTVLYDNLLRRFILREREKNDEFRSRTKKVREAEVDQDLQRLGVAAIGMYNRRKLHILSPELDEDIKCFQMERNIAVESGRQLSQADLLLGGFFFVHKSKLLQKAEEPNQYEEIAAFEFLHNTFGEFLTADFILRQAVAEVELLAAFRSSENLRAELSRRLDRPDAFTKPWIASLVYTPLFSRPVVLEMIREWAFHCVKKKGLDYPEFVVGLHEIVINQIRRILLRRHMPPLITGDDAAPFPKHPLLGHMAIYTVNLITLRAVTASDGFVFRESDIGAHEDGTRPWDQLTHLWRSWFSLENLSGLTAVFDAVRPTNPGPSNRPESIAEVQIAPKKVLEASVRGGRLGAFLNVSSTLADNMDIGLAGLLAYNSESNSQLPLDTISNCLRAEGIDVELQIVVKKLLNAMWKTEGSDSRSSINRLLSVTLRQAISAGRLNEILVLLGLIAMRGRRAGGRILEWPFFRYAHQSGSPVSLDLFEVDMPFVLPKKHRSRVGFEEEEFVTYYQADFGQGMEAIGFARPVEIAQLIDRFQEFGVDVLRYAADVGAPISPIYWEEVASQLASGGLLQRLIKTHPEAALDLIDFMAQGGGRRIRIKLPRELLLAIEKSELLPSIARRRPELIVTLSRVLETERSGALLRSLEKELCEAVLSPDTFIGMVSRRPDDAEILLERFALSSDLGKPNWNSKQGKAALSELLSPTFLVRIYEASETVGGQFLKFLARILPSSTYEMYIANLLEYLNKNGELAGYIRRRSSFVVDVLQVSEDLKSRDVFDRFSSAVSTLLGSVENARAFVRSSSIENMMEMIRLLDAGGHRQSVGQLRYLLNSELAVGG